MEINSTLLGSGVDLSSALQTVTNSDDGDAFKTALESAQASEDDEAIKEVCQQFESLFIGMLLKQMRSTVQDGGLTEKSQARETFESMLDEEMAKEMAENGGIGIADLMYKALSGTAYADASSDVSETASIDSEIMDLLTGSNE